MKIRNYLIWKMYSAYVDAIINMTMIAISAYIILTRVELGTNIIPVFEALIMLGGFIGVKIAHSRLKIPLKILLLLNTSLELIVSIAILYYTITNDLTLVAVSLYLFIVATRINGAILSEATRDYEDKVMKPLHYKSILKKLRKKNQTLNLSGAVAGTIIATVSLTVLELEITSYAIVLVSIHTVVCVLDLLGWFRYVR